MEHKLGIVIPAVNCLEYSKQTINSIKTKHPYQIIFVDNGSTDGTKEWLDEHPEIIAYKNPIVSGLAESWNIAIQRAFDEGCDLVAVLNNDIVLAPNTLDNMIKRFEKGDLILVTGVNSQESGPEGTLSMYKELDENEQVNHHPDFSCFLISQKTIDTIGWFDTNMMVAYFEDSDFAARIVLAGENCTSITGGAYYHWGSKTIKENTRLQEIIHDAFRHNEDYFERKWGHKNVGDEPEMLKLYHKTPFNNPNKDIKNIDFEFSL